MKIKLLSDFRDIYDHWFSFDAETTFVRKTHDHKISREMMFEFFSKHGLRTPIHGAVEDVVEKIIARRHRHKHRFVGDISHVVIHRSSYTTQGEGKILLPLGGDLRPFYGAFAVEHIPSEINGSRTERMLRIGKYIFWIEYRSPDWRSNVGDVAIRMIKQDRPVKIGSMPIDKFAPITSIDFVRCGNFIYAIDLNTAPMISKTGVEEILSGKQIFAECEEWFSLKK